MRFAQIMIVAEVFIASCATTRATRAPASASKTAQDPTSSGSDEEVETPGLCNESARPLDRVGKAYLIELEQHLAAAVLSDTAEDHGLFNIGDLHSLIRKYPDAEMAFIFPSQVRLPKSAFRTRAAANTSEIEKADHPIFYLELSDVGMVGSGNQTALVFDYAAWPTGARPKNTVWMWGLSGRYCVTRAAAGRWSAFPIGVQIMSNADSEKPTFAFRS